MADDLLTPPASSTGFPPSGTGTENGAPASEVAKALTRVIQEGKESIPASPEPLVCKPQRVEPWRVFKIMSEFVEGFEIIKKYGLAATFFGSARCGFEDHFYAAATELSGRLAKRGFAVITGGSAGIMEAANRGAYEAGGASVGLNIRLNTHQAPNTFLTDYYQFEHFFVRKVMLAYASEVYIWFPGGFGTLDEFFEMLTLVQTQKVRKVPLILYGKEYWQPLQDLIQKKLYEEHHAVDEDDMQLYRIVDSVDEAYEYIIANVKC